MPSLASASSHCFQFSPSVLLDSRASFVTASEARPPVDLIHRIEILGDQLLSSRQPITPAHSVSRSPSRTFYRVTGKTYRLRNSIPQESAAYAQAFSDFRADEAVITRRSSPLLYMYSSGGDARRNRPSQFSCSARSFKLSPFQQFASGSLSRFDGTTRSRRNCVHFARKGGTSER